MVVSVYKAERVPVSIHNELQIHLDRVSHAATYWSDTNYHLATEQLENEMPKVTLFNC